jgi:DNA-binding MarR family transcriptional regulator
MSDRPRLYSNDPEGEFLTDVPVMLFLFVFQILRRNDAQNEKLLRPLGLTVVTWRALLIIDRLSPCTMNDLARVSAIERTTLTRTIDHLVAEGLASRATPPEDRRQVRISLTPAGIAALDDGKRIIYASQHAAVEGIDPERVRDATRVLQSILANLVENPAAIAATIGLTPPGPDEGR